MPPVAICLCMIVRNESRILRRCLDAALPVIDALSICDTGSTDETVPVVCQFMAETGIPGRVHAHEWKDFGHNRTLSLHAAVQAVTELGLPREQTYFLLLDADMVLVREGGFSREELTADSYLLTQRAGTLTYPNVRLIRGGKPWRSTGVTHEYWECLEAGHSREKLATLWIDDRNDGGCKSDKLERDIRLLTQGLAAEPDNARYMFYLAQTYRGSGQHQEAIDWYTKRIAAGGWDEEIWCSKYMIGSCYESMGETEKAHEACLSAYHARPTRAEPLCRLATMYRHLGMNHLAYHYASLGEKIPFPADELLFIEHDVYRYRLHEEIAITAYYTGHRAHGRAAADAVKLHRDVPDTAREQAHRNQFWYLEALPGRSTLFRPDLGPGVRPTNPTILADSAGYVVLCRAVDTLTDEHGYSPIGGGSAGSSGLCLLELDAGFRVRDHRETVEDGCTPGMSEPDGGFEEYRLFEWKGERWFSCAGFGAEPQDVPPLSVGRLERDGRVETLIPLSGLGRGTWLPFVVNKKPRLIGSLDPTTIVEPNLKAGRSRLVAQNTPRRRLDRCCGGAGPVPFEDGYLMLVYEDLEHADQPRRSMHRFVFLSREFVVARITLPFCFQGKPDVRVGGACLDPTGQDLVITYGVEDRESWIHVVSLDVIQSMLRTL